MSRGNLACRRTRRTRSLRGRLVRKKSCVSDSWNLENDTTNVAICRKLNGKVPTGARDILVAYRECRRVCQENATRKLLPWNVGMSTNFASAAILVRSIRKLQLQYYLQMYDMTTNCMTVFISMSLIKFDAEIDST